MARICHQRVTVVVERHTHLLAATEREHRLHGRPLVAVHEACASAMPTASSTADG
jgi:hypothetical protein